jgi:Ca-activated chloride channel family protein
MFVKRLAICPIVLMLFAMSGAAQAPDRQSAQPVFRSGASLVALNVTVADPGRQSVPGLQAEDFAVYEDGVQQEIRFFETAAVPVDLIVLLDTSSSMRHQMEIVHKAAEGFIGTLRDGDRGAVVAFSDRVNIVQELTSDRDALLRATRGTTALGGTALYNALYIALKQFGQPARLSAGIRRQAIVVLSDGDDTSSLIEFNDVLDVARKSGVSIYPIALESELEANVDRPSLSGAQYSMRQLARETGGEAFSLKEAFGLRVVYASIAAELSNQYSIGYAPSDVRPDGRFRRIVVRVTSRPELRPRARTGYVAEAQRTVLSHPPNQ